MMSKMYRLFFSILQKVMLVLGLHWLLMSVLHLLDLAVWGLPATLVIFGLGYLFRSKIKQVYHFLMRHKGWVMAVVVAVQLLFLVSAELLIRRDAAVVFTGAFGYLKEISISSYLTRNPNNLFLFLYERFFFKLFGEPSLWVMQGLNLLFVNLGAWVLYRGSKRHFSQQVAETSFSLYALLACLSPYFYSMYTDIPILPLVAWQIFLILDIFSGRNSRAVVKTSVLLSLVTGLVVLIRPPGAILLIACFMVLFFKGNWRKFFLVLASFLVAFGLSFGTGNYLINHQKEVPIIQEEGLAKGPLLFINLGLTYTGSEQGNMKEGLLQYVEPAKRKQYNNGMFKNEYVIQEIKRRLREYTPLTFLEHLVVKESLTVRDGDLGWSYRDATNEKTPYISPLYEKTKNIGFFQWVRTYFLSIDQEQYRYYAISKQVVWIVMSFGLVLALWKYRGQDSYNLLALAIFGGLAFLLIFEGGKTRYLIQFLPQILLLASLGLADKKKT